MKFIISLFLCLYLLLPLAAQAQTVLKTPLSLTMQEWGFALGAALLGGLASWYMKVRRGEIMPWNLAAMIGELCVSAFAGLMAYLLCEYFRLDPMLTPAIVGMSGHAGAKGITWLEAIGQRIMEKKLGIEPAKDAP